MASGSLIPPPTRADIPGLRESLGLGTSTSRPQTREMKKKKKDGRLGIFNVEGRLCGDREAWLARSAQSRSVLFVCMPPLSPRPVLSRITEIPQT